MKFRHCIAAPCSFASSSVGDSEMLATVACKLTCRIDERGVLVPVALDQAWPLLNEPSELLGVTLQPDVDFRRPDVDVLVVGPAVTPGGKPARAMKVQIECGQLKWEAAVFGDRVWIVDEQGVRASEAEEFTTMPLTPERAYGGASSFGGMALMDGMNPAGRGYVAEKAVAGGTKLPNIERVGELVRTWEDRPSPISTGRFMGGAMGFTSSGPLSVQELGKPERIGDMAERFMQAGLQSSPLELTCPAKKLGAELLLRGFEAGGDLRWKLPPVRANYPAVIGEAWGPVAHVAVGALRSAFPLAISRIVALPSHRVLCLTYSTSFRWMFEREQAERSCGLVWHGAWTLDPWADRAEIAAMDARARAADRAAEYGRGSAAGQGVLP